LLRAAFAKIEAVTTDIDSPAGGIHVYLPAEWMARKYPKHAERFNAIASRVKERYGRKPDTQTQEGID
jgi:hypothetical protein